MKNKIIDAIREAILDSCTVDVEGYRINVSEDHYGRFLTVHTPDDSQILHTRYGLMPRVDEIATIVVEHMGGCWC